MMRCPIVGTSVSTGLTTEMIVFDSIEADLKIPMRCPACLKMHNWMRKDVWIDKADSLGNA
jgi:hypothetical protein